MPESQALIIHLSVDLPPQAPELTILMHLGASGNNLSNLLEQINSKINLQETLT